MCQTTQDHDVYKKTLLVGKGRRFPGATGAANCDVELHVTLRQVRHGLELSVTGSVWNHIRSDIVCGGQMHDCLEAYVVRWTESRAKVRRILEIARRWHLNGMRAGCEHQRAAGEHSAWAGVYPEKGYPAPRCQVCGYSYGNQWLHEELPAEIVEEIKSW